MEQKEISLEKIHASAVHFLISENKNDAALVLLSCEVTLEEIDTWNGTTGYALYLRGPVQVYKTLKSEDDAEESIEKNIKYAFNAVLPARDCIDKIVPLVSLIDIEPDWKAQMFDIAQGKAVHNQGVEIKDRATITWKNLRFRSVSEMKVAEALERAKVLFLPNCLARLNTLDGRKTKEADFIICNKGKWGIIEVDGEPFHPPTRTPQDHKRDQDFYAHGAALVLHFDATECFEQPDKVVLRFLKLLEDR